MSRLGNLKSAATLGDLASLLQFKASGLSYILYKQPAAAKYTTFQIPKKNGGTRTIQAPASALKLVQQRLSVLLQDCVDEINTATGRKDRIAHGFKRKLSISTNAWEHRGRSFVFNIDLEDFFPSINFGRVRGYFIRDKHFALNDAVATVIAQIACHGNALPQGSPCSPVISNLIAHVLDIHLVRLASKCGCTYSRYADDLTFSTNKKDFPKEIAELSDPLSQLWKPGPELQRLILHSGFRINPTKTHMQYRTSRQQVTGLVVNKRINTRFEYRHTLRAMVHQLINTGAFEKYAVTDISGTPTIKKEKGTPNQLHGMLGFVDFIEQYHQKHSGDPKDRKHHGNTKGAIHSSSLELMYRRFLVYCYFFAAEAPVVLCEGETDNVYLTHAIRNLVADYPELATLGSDGKIHIDVRLYKYRKSSTARVLGLGDGGSSVLAAFIGTYKKETARFNGPGQKYPVIVLYDNDTGAAPIRRAVKDACGKTLNAADPFTHVVRNLYVMGTPLLNNAQESKIEDFFEPAVLATVIAGKTFDAANNIDTATHYGKKVFAYGVVRKHASSINFDGFRPLLTNLKATIDFHTANVLAAAGPINP